MQCLGHAEAALEALVLACRLDPGHETAWVALSLAYRAQGRLPEAEAVLDRGLSAVGPRHAVLVALAETLLLQGRPAEVLAWRRPVLVLDADLIVTRPLAAVLPPDADIALFDLDSPASDPWNRFQASVVLVRPTPAAWRLASFVKHAIAFWFDRGRSDWYLDQVALFAGLVHRDRVAPGLRLAALPNALLRAGAGEGDSPAALAAARVAFLSFLNTVPTHRSATGRLIDAVS